MLILLHGAIERNNEVGQFSFVDIRAACDVPDGRFKWSIFTHRIDDGGCDLASFSIGCYRSARSALRVGEFNSEAFRTFNQHVVSHWQRDGKVGHTGTVRWRRIGKRSAGASSIRCECDVRIGVGGSLQCVCDRIVVASVRTKVIQVDIDGHNFACAEGFRQTDGKDSIFAFVD